jgi:hypothetical protein
MFISLRDYGLQAEYSRLAGQIYNSFGVRSILVPLQELRDAMGSSYCSNLD